MASYIQGGRGEEGSKGRLYMQAHDPLSLWVLLFYCEDVSITTYIARFYIQVSPNNFLIYLLPVEASLLYYYYYLLFVLMSK